MTPCCLLYALPIYLESPDDALWLYSSEGRSFKLRQSLHSTWISACINRVGCFYSQVVRFMDDASSIGAFKCTCAVSHLMSVPRIVQSIPLHLVSCHTAPRYPSSLREKHLIKHYATLTEHKWDIVPYDVVCDGLERRSSHEREIKEMKTVFAAFRFQPTNSDPVRGILQAHLKWLKI